MNHDLEKELSEGNAKILMSESIVTKIMVALVILLVSELGLAIWWASSLDTKVQGLADDFKELQDSAIVVRLTKLEDSTIALSQSIQVLAETVTIVATEQAAQGKEQSRRTVIVDHAQKHVFDPNHAKPAK